MRRVRGRIFGNSERPRLCVFRSLKNFSAQIVNDVDGKTLCAVSSLEKAIREKHQGGNNVKLAALLGAEMAARAKAAGITKTVFDRRHYQFHGRVKAFAEAARKNGLNC